MIKRKKRCFYIKTNGISRKVEDLSHKLEDTTISSLVHIDFNSLSDAEKAIFRKVDEVNEEYQQTGNEQILAKNNDLIYKNIEIMQKHAKELFCFTYPKAICGYTALNFEIVNHFFQLHFINFEIDLKECVKNLRKWNESDKKEFLADLKKYGPFYFRIPRGFNDQNDCGVGNSDDSADSDKADEENKEIDNAAPSATDQEQQT